VARVLFVAIGVAAVIIGVIGIFLPVLPTTPFLLVAAWAFGKSSPRLHAWLREHPRLGPYVRDWDEAGVIPVRAKVASITMMSASLAWVALGTNAPRIGVVTMGTTLAVVGLWILTRPSRAPTTARR
jgi:uncharacterized membrane protein YbaN (DUF454 family)